MFEAVRQRLGGTTPRSIREPGAAQAAVAVILAPGADAALDVLFIKRAQRAGDPWSGQMALPGGRRDGEDRTLLETARREVAEETGIALEEAQCIGRLDDLHPVARQLPSIVVRPFVFGVARKPRITPSDEVALHVWASVATLDRSSQVVDVDVRESRYTVDAFVVGPHVIWGMTHRIIKPFLDLVNL